jgi:hypothetical protein
MDALEKEYPKVIFIYMTGHLDGTGEHGNLNMRNNQIRDFCRRNHKVLYDFAVSVHRAPHLLCYRAFEVRPVRLHARCRASTAPCKRLQGSALQYIGHFNPVNRYKRPVRLLGKRCERKLGRTLVRSKPGKMQFICMRSFDAVEL